MNTRIFTTEHTLNGRAVTRAFTEKVAAIAYARETVDNPEASAVSLWEYRASSNPREMLCRCFEKGEWWDSRNWLGVVDKAGRFIANRTPRMKRGDVPGYVLRDMDAGAKES